MFSDFDVSEDEGMGKGAPGSGNGLERDTNGAAGESGPKYVASRRRREAPCRDKNGPGPPLYTATRAWTEPAAPFAAFRRRSGPARHAGAGGL